MRASFVVAATAAVLVMSAAAQAQDLPMAPAAGDATQHNAQGSAAPGADSSYGGAMSTSKASGAARDTWAVSTSQACTPGLSCNIYSGQ